MRAIGWPAGFGFDVDDVGAIIAYLKSIQQP
jgi:hypothetical protein